MRRGWRWWWGLGTILVLSVGCCSIPKAELAKQAGFAARDFRETNIEIVPLIPENLRADWTENLVTSAVRCRVMQAALLGERGADQKALEADEFEAVKAGRGVE